jgi:hypothetical protein
VGLVWGLSSGIEFFCYSSNAPQEHWAVIVSLAGGAEDMETPLNPENSGPHISYPAA